MTRMNLGAGSIQPQGWVHVDARPVGLDEEIADIKSSGDVDFLIREYGHFDYIVANHLLSCFSHWELLDPVLPNIFKLLKPGGVFRILVPDAEKAIRAYLNEDRAWFPLDNDIHGINSRFCTFLPWFGESKSIFTEMYLISLGFHSGFGASPALPHGVSLYLPDSEIASLDDRELQALRMEFRRPE